MRRIVKTHPPRSLTQWVRDNQGLNDAYEHLSAEAHADLHNQLLSEQGYLCGYTGRYISAETSHIEHIKPQTCCENGEDVDYRNVIACFPADGGDKSYGYGAPVKAGWWDENNFISPCSEECGRRFTYKWSGAVEAVPNNYDAANKTIEVLKLNAEELKELRKSRIKGFFGYGRRSTELNPALARQLLDNIDVIGGNGKLKEFCFVLKCLIPRYLNAG